MKKLDMYVLFIPCQGLVLRDGSDSFENWLSPPVPVYMQFWVWNVTNPDQIVNGLEKPKLAQMGPYTYRYVKSNTLCKPSDLTILAQVVKTIFELTGAGHLNSR